jgi:hypothetical protein
MKVVLSRKEFDSATGGGPRPILSGGRLLSLPIPELGCPEFRGGSGAGQKGRFEGGLFELLG